jgi:acyl carrier protein
MPDNLMERVIRVIAETQHLAVEQIRPESTFEELHIDSLDGINILFGLENEFNINIPDDDAKDIRTVQDLADGVRKLVGEGGTAVAV